MKTVVRNISITVLSFGATMVAFAQKTDAKSKSILDAVTTKYHSNKNNYFKFTYGTGSNGKVTKRQTGIFYTTSTQYKLKIMGIEQIFDGKKVYNISDEDQEVTIANPNGSEMMFSPTNYLKNYKKDYNTQYVGKRNIKGISTDLILLKPIKDNGIKNVYIYVNTPKNQLVKIEQYTTNNDVAVIEVSDYKMNQNLSADLFTFNKNKYSNYIITEL